MAKERLTTEEIKNEMLLHTDAGGGNVLYLAAYESNLDAFREIWELAKERLTTEEIKIEML